MDTKLFFIIILFITIIITLFYCIDLETNIIILLSIIIFLLFNKEHFKIVDINSGNSDSSIMKLQENQDKKIDSMIELINKYNKAQRTKDNSDNNYNKIIEVEVENSCIRQDIQPRDLRVKYFDNVKNNLVINCKNNKFNLPASITL
jgi:hypothetical protein